MKVNGKYIGLPVPMTVMTLITDSGYKEDRVAVELNGKIVPRSQYPNVELKDDDSIEIVGLVGGG